MMTVQNEDTGTTRRYHWLKEERNQFQGLGNENFTEAMLTVKQYRDAAGSALFGVSMADYKQSNTEGMYLLVGMLHQLRSEIVFTLNGEGRIGEIRNLNSIAKKWDGLKGNFDSRLLAHHPYAKSILGDIGKLVADGGQLAAALRHAAPYITLFPGLHAVVQSGGSGPVPGHRELPNFLAAPKVPIITREQLLCNMEHNYEVRVTGAIDHGNFEQGKLTAMIRILKNRPRVPALLQLKYEERILLDSEYHLLQNVCMSLACVPGSLYREESSIIRAL